jgi:hypothetical protein
VRGQLLLAVLFAAADPVGTGELTDTTAPEEGAEFGILASALLRPHPVSATIPNPTISLSFIVG